MILDDSPSTEASHGGGPTLDDIFRHAAARRPDAIALADPPNRPDFTDGRPRRLTYAEADRIISAIAGRLLRLGLATDAVVALQLPNTVESVLTLLGVLRAGLIAAPLPLLWRRAEAASALRRLNARVIVAHSNVGGFDHCELAMHAAAEVFPIRYICGFGDKRSDGVIPLDELLGAATTALPPITREGSPAAHVAVVTWDVTPDGLVPVARNHGALATGGMAIMLEGRLEQDATIVTPCPLSSFAGLSLSLVPWLLTGGTLLLHHGFDPAVFAAQCAQGCDTVVLPAPIVPQLAAAGLFDRAGARNVLALWRTPERLAAAPAWPHPEINLIDVLAFGEIALFGARRTAAGAPAPIPLGPVTAPRGAAGGVTVAELSRSDTGTLMVRGAMVPQRPFPPGSAGAGPQLKVDGSGLADTGYACRADHATQTLVVTGPPPGIVNVGGYRFLVREMQEMAARTEASAGIAVLPDALAGNRLAGHAADRAEVRTALVAGGVNPLVSDAFRDRRRPPEVA
jgi:hypothetical protein